MTSICFLTNRFTRFAVILCVSTFFFADSSLSQTASPTDSNPNLPIQKRPSHTDVTKNPSNVCELLTAEEIQNIQRSRLEAVHGSQFAREGYRVTHCLYQTADVNRGISVSIIEADPDDPQKYQVRTLWKKMFTKESEEEKESEKGDPTAQAIIAVEDEDESEEISAHYKKVGGFGNKAYWVTNQAGGALYILKGEKILRLSIGGRDSLTRKLKNTKALAHAVIMQF